jgi:hypothetical protein
MDIDLIQDPTRKSGSGLKQISDISVLLPVQNCSDSDSPASQEHALECRKAEKLIYATNGCYKWKVSHPHLVQLSSFQSQSHPECANIVRISSVQPKETKTTVWLTA